MCICFVTTPSAEVADALSKALVESRAAACVNQIPGITSVYMWEGKLNRDTEMLLVIKTCRNKVPLALPPPHPHFLLSKALPPPASPRVRFRAASTRRARAQTRRG